MDNLVGVMAEALAAPFRALGPLPVGAQAHAVARLSLDLRLGHGTRAGPTNLAQTRAQVVAMATVVKAKTKNRSRGKIWDAEKEDEYAGSGKGGAGRSGRPGARGGADTTYGVEFPGEVSSQILGLAWEGILALARTTEVVAGPVGVASTLPTASSSSFVRPVAASELLVPAVLPALVHALGLVAARAVAEKLLHDALGALQSLTLACGGGATAHPELLNLALADLCEVARVGAKATRSLGGGGRRSSETESTSSTSSSPSPSPSPSTGAADTSRSSAGSENRSRTLHALRVVTNATLALTPVL